MIDLSGFKILKRRQKIKVHEVQLKKVYDDGDALEFIHKETGFDRKTIRAVMNADLRYQQSVGIIQWDDLDAFIKYWTEDAEIKDTVLN